MCCSSSHIEPTIRPPTPLLLPLRAQWAASAGMAHQALAMTLQKPLLVAELRWGHLFMPCSDEQNST